MLLIFFSCDQILPLDFWASIWVFLLLNINNPFIPHRHYLIAFCYLNTSLLGMGRVNKIKQYCSCPLCGKVKSSVIWRHKLNTATEKCSLLSQSHTNPCPPYSRPVSYVSSPQLLPQWCPAPGGREGGRPGGALSPLAGRECRWRSPQGGRKVGRGWQWQCPLPYRLSSTSRPGPSLPSGWVHSICQKWEKCEKSKACQKATQFWQHLCHLWWMQWWAVGSS